MIPDFAGRTIEIVRIDWGLHLWTDDNWQFTLSEVQVATDSQDGPAVEAVEVDVEQQPLPPALAGLEGETIRQVLVSKSGDLSIQLADRHLTVRADPKYEAWQLMGPKGEMLICMPGGEIAHFPARAAPDEGGSADDGAPSPAN